MFADEINATPRKRLYYHTLKELFEAQLDRIYAVQHELFFRRAVFNLLLQFSIRK